MSPSDIAALRAALGLNPLQLADRLQVDPRLVLQWESGDRFPTKKHCQMMRKLVDVQASALPMAPPPAAPPPPTDPPIEAMVRRLLDDPRFLAALRDLVATHFNSSSESRSSSTSESSRDADSAGSGASLVSSEVSSPTASNSSASVPESSVVSPTSGCSVVSE